MIPKPNENTLYKKIKPTLPFAIPDSILKYAVSLAPNQPYGTQDKIGQVTLNERDLRR